MTAHPEKGGDPKTFQKLNKAVTVSKIRWKMHKTDLTEQRHESVRLRYICSVSVMSFVGRCYIVLAISVVQDAKVC